MRASHIAHVLVLGIMLTACTSPDAVVTSTPPPDSVGPAFAPLAGAPAFGEPLANLTADELARFAAGLEEFLAAEAVDEGLGPVFNEASCVTCHNNPVGGTTGRKEMRFGRPSPERSIP